MSLSYINPQSFRADRSMMERNILCVTWVESHQQRPGRFLGVVGRVPSVPNCNRLHVYIFGFSLSNWGISSQISLHRSVVFPESPELQAAISHTQPVHL